VIKPEGMGRLKWYVKHAISKYNEGDDSLARQRLLVKVKIGQGDLEFEPYTEKDQEKLEKARKEGEKMLQQGVKVKHVKGDLKFEPCTEKDQEKLELARQEIEKLLKQKDPDIPKEELAPYGTQAIGGYLQPLNYNMTEWYKLFNPRQLLTLVKLVKLIREAGKLIEEEKIKEGLSKEEAFRYAEAIATYLATMLTKYVDHNTLCTCWHPVLLIIAHTLSMRGIAMMWNWTDENPCVRFVGSWTRSSENIANGLNYLVSAISGSPNKNGTLPNMTSLDIGGYKSDNLSRIRILLDDATILSKLDKDEKFDLIVTDPPYYDDVPYAELSDFYYVWLKRALSDVVDNKLVPRFIPEAFFERIGDSWVEISTQWEKYALSEVSMNPPRLGPDAKKEDGIKHFQNLLNASFNTMSSRLKENGLLVTFYAHTSPDAWKALLEAGWESAGLRVTNAFPLITESEQSVVKRGKLSMDTSIIVVWRKGSEGSIDASDLYKEMADSSARKARDLIDLNITGRDLIIGTLAEALSVATKYKDVKSMGRIDVRTLVDKYIYPASLLGLARALAYKADLRETVKSPEAMFYLIVKFALSGMKEKIIESTDARIFSIGTSLDLKKAINLRILRERESKGAKVAKAKSLVLMEPISEEKAKLEEFLEVRGISVRDPNIRCSIDALHILEYYSVAFPCGEFRNKVDELKSRYLSQVEEALLMAKIMVKALSSDDRERSLCQRIIECLEPAPKGAVLELG
jgi:putative DNA methylase